MDILERVKGILLKPKDEWPVIEREPGDVQSIFKEYVAILALIPAVCGFIATSIVGIDLGPLGTLRLSIFQGLLNAIATYLLSLALVYVVALIADALATGFGGQKNFGNALKLTAYSYTPFWLAGVFVIIPWLGWLAVLGLYGLYLLYVGAPVMMKVPKEKSVFYTVILVVCAIVIGAVVGMVQAKIFL